MFVHTVAVTKKIKWVLHPIVMAMAMEKMGIMETGGGVHIAMSTENKKDVSTCKSKMFKTKSMIAGRV